MTPEGCEKILEGGPDSRPDHPDFQKGRPNNGPPTCDMPTRRAVRKKRDSVIKRDRVRVTVQIKRDSVKERDRVQVLCKKRDSVIKGIWLGVHA